MNVRETIDAKVVCLNKGDVTRLESARKTCKEMAAAGMWVVSNECENKTQAEMSGISTNLLAARPTISGVSEQLAWAAANCDDIAARREGAEVRWASNWDTTFDAKKMKLILAWLDEQA